MTLLEKINKLTWFSEIIKLKDILKDLLSQIISVQTDIEDLQNNQGGSGVQSVSGYYIDNTDPLNPILNDPRPYKVYSALIGQSGTNPPTVIAILENTLNINPIWSYNGVGSYILTSANSFNIQKTTLEIGMTEQNLGKGAFWDVNEDFVAIKTYNTSNTISNNILTRTLFEVKVYN